MWRVFLFFFSVSLVSVFKVQILSAFKFADIMAQTLMHLFYFSSYPSLRPSISLKIHQVRRKTKRKGNVCVTLKQTWGPDTEQLNSSSLTIWHELKVYNLWPRTPTCLFSPPTCLTECFTEPRGTLTDCKVQHQWLTRRFQRQTCSWEVGLNPRLREVQSLSLAIRMRLAASIKEGRVGHQVRNLIHCCSFLEMSNMS